jgi:hypothetical protein
MLLTVSALLALNFQVQIGPSRRRPPTVRDSITDSTGTPSNRRRNNNYRKAVTADLLATAFKDQTARTTLLHARTARLSQDSLLTSYDAMSYQRISAGMGFTKLGRDRLLFRHESAARVRWQAGVGVWMEAKGQRTALPAISSEEAKKEINDEMGSGDVNASIPYFPGYEPLWVGNEMARAQVDESEIVNPIADGAEAYYTYETGDSVSFTLPNKTTIQLRELRIRPRVPKWNLAVGSLWFDTKSGQLVRAAYRLSIPLDIWQIAQEEDPKSMDDVPVWVKPMISPMKAEVSADRDRVFFARRPLLDAAASPRGRQRSGELHARAVQDGRELQIRERERQRHVAAHSRHAGDATCTDARLAECRGTSGVARFGSCGGSRAGAGDS